MDDSTRRVLGWLGRLRRVKVWIISGRRRADVQRRAKVPGVRYLGLHGWERDGKIRFGRNAQKLLQRVRRQLAERLKHLREIWIEDKTFSLAVHYRGVASGTVRRARAAVRELLGPLASEVRLLTGKKVWEILPREIEGKGAAVRALIEELPGTTLSLYVGDDTTDESAFRVLRRGITVCVGKSSRTAARYWLRNPREVRRFLEKLEAEVG